MTSAGLTRPRDPLRLARNRIKKVLREHLVVASARTLEVKLSERGPYWMQEACPPHVVTKALKQLLQTFQDIEVVAGPNLQPLPHCPCKLFALTGASGNEFQQALEHRIYLATLYEQHSSRAHDPTNAIGKAGEDAVHSALERSGHFIIGQSWGHVRIPGSDETADGLIYDPRLPVNKSGLLVEIKNKREWIYHDAFEIWKHFRNSYLMDCVPLFFARRIHDNTFEYVFKRIGGLGIEMRAQFAPPELREVLVDAVHPDGLDYFDLRFTRQPGPRFIMRTKRIFEHVVLARDRLERSRHIVFPFLDELADEGIRGAYRSRLYWNLQQKLNEAGIEPFSLAGY